jgi:hypothetical protein
MMKPLLFCLLTLLTTSYSVFAADWKHAVFATSEGAQISIDYQLKTVAGNKTTASPVWVNLTLPRGADCNVRIEADFQQLRYVYSSPSSSHARPENFGPVGYARLEFAEASRGCRFTARVADLMIRDPSDAFAARKLQFSTLFRFYRNHSVMRRFTDHGPLFQLFFDESH